ncbi:MAG: SWIM zinc finger family protein [Thermoplasmataceae archaeon]
MARYDNLAGAESKDKLSKWLSNMAEYMELVSAGKRYSRGTVYASSGNVTHMNISGRTITASVIVSNWNLYKVKIYIQQFSLNRMKARIEEMVTKHNISDPASIYACFSDSIANDDGSLIGDLLPHWKDLGTSCSCLDQNKPCKHIFAVMLKALDTMKREPANVLTFIGIDRLSSILRYVSPESRKTANTLYTTSDKSLNPYRNRTETDATASNINFMEQNYGNFYGILPVDTMNITSNPENVNYPFRRTQEPEFWEGHSSLLKTLQRIYDTVSEEAGRILEEIVTTK